MNKKTLNRYCLVSYIRLGKNIVQFKPVFVKYKTFIKKQIICVIYSHCLNMKNSKY